MTAHQETRFRCDRCGVDEVLPADGSGPVHNRMAGPETWLMLRVGSDPSALPKHLCPDCATGFANYMAMTTKPG